MVMKIYDKTINFGMFFGKVVLWDPLYFRKNPGGLKYYSIWPDI